MEFEGNLIIVNGLLAAEECMGYLRVHIKRHRWFARRIDQTIHEDVCDTAGRSGWGDRRREDEL
jgi:hypothetical protein